MAEGEKADSELIASISAILYAADPCGLADDAGDNPDEYELEAGLVAAKLPTCRSVVDVHRRIYETFVECIDPQTAGDPLHYRAAAEEVWALWLGRSERA